MLPQANGSARVRLLTSGTEVLAAVKAEVGEPLASRPLEGRVECSVECWTSASPLFEGRGAEEINAELTRTLSGYVRARSHAMLSACCAAVVWPCFVTVSWLSLTAVCWRPGCWRRPAR